jgi:cell division septation protein DedD
MTSDKHLIEEHICGWLLEHDSLLIPELGQFESSYQGAEVHSGIHHWMPPSKRISFYPSSKYNDGQFEAYLSEQTGLPLADIQDKVRQYVAAVKIEVSVQRSYTIHGLGTLYLDEGEVMSFKMAENANLLGDSYGLPNLFSKPVDREEPAENLDEEDPIFEEEPEEYDRIRKRRPIGRYVGAGIVLTGTAIGAWYLANSGIVPKLLGDKGGDTAVIVRNQEDTSQDTGEDLSTDEQNLPLDERATPSATETPANTQNTPVETPAKTDNKAAKNTQGNTTNSQSVKVELPPPNRNILGALAINPTPPANLSQVLIKAPSKQFYVIVGSFDKAENAYSLYNHMTQKGFRQLRIVEQGNRVRVSSYVFADREQAKTHEQTLKTQYGIDAWVLQF